MAVQKFVKPANVVILLVEDRPDDVDLIQRALRQAHITNTIAVTRDGEEALAYLKGEGIFADRHSYPFPHIMLLDLKMPRMDGFEVLREMRGHREWSSIRVIVLTSSDQVYDLNQAYQLGAASFLVKPNDFQDYAALIRTFTTFWLNKNVGLLDESSPVQQPEI